LVRTSEPAACVEQILRRVGPRLRVATPLGLGKPVRLLNALYQRAKADPGVELHIFTALTLQRPQGRSELEQRLLGPFVERVFGDCPDLDYELDRVAGRLPPNVRVFEFYFPAGKLTRNAAAQRDYINSNYTHVVRDLLQRDPNVIVQMVASGRDEAPGLLSLSCNADLTLDLLDAFAALPGSGADRMVIGQVNDELPFMYGDAVLAESRFDVLLEGPGCNHRLFPTPRMRVSDAELAIGLWASALVPDGGTLQIGIGGVGDAIAYALCLRQRENATYLRALAGLDVARAQGCIERFGQTAVFEQGLFGATEMLVDGFMHLHRAGILKRAAGGDGPDADAVVHAGFFLGPSDFYRWLRELPVEERRRIHMKSVTRVNQLYGDEVLRRQQRRDARFVNTGLMLTLLGAAVSDGLEDGSVISGVGGQYNFVAMAHELPGARSVLQFRSTRGSGPGLSSNLQFSYGHATIPRHLRDVVVTEYGCADLRGKSDEEVLQAVLNLADSRFQPELLEAAKRSGKLAADYAIPAPFRDNLPERYEQPLATLRSEGWFEPFPFGTELTHEEQVLGRVLTRLQAKIESVSGKLEVLADAILEGSVDAVVLPYLERMGLSEPQSLKESLYQRLLAAELRDEVG
jgi:acyl-CoA hydrolase